MTIQVVQRLTEDELAAARIVADVEPIADLSPWTALRVEGFVYVCAGCTRIDTADDHVDGVVITGMIVLPVL